MPYECDAEETFKHLSVDDPARYSSLLTQVCDNQPVAGLMGRRLP